MNGKPKHFKQSQCQCQCQGEDTAPSFPVAERIFERQGLPEAEPTAGVDAA